MKRTLEDSNKTMRKKNFKNIDKMMRYVKN